MPMRLFARRLERTSITRRTCRHIGHSFLAALPQRFHAARRTAGLWGWLRIPPFLSRLLLSRRSLPARLPGTAFMGAGRRGLLFEEISASMAVSTRCRSPCHVPVCAFLRRPTCGRILSPSSVPVPGSVRSFGKSRGFAGKITYPGRSDDL